MGKKIWKKSARFSLDILFCSENFDIFAWLGITKLTRIPYVTIGQYLVFSIIFRKLANSVTVFCFSLRMFYLQMLPEEHPFTTLPTRLVNFFSLLSYEVLQWLLAGKPRKIRNYFCWVCKNTETPHILFVSLAPAFTSFEWQLNLWCVIINLLMK